MTESVRGSAADAFVAHAHEEAGSTPAPATNRSSVQGAVARVAPSGADSGPFSFGQVEIDEVNGGIDPARERARPVWQDEENASVLKWSQRPATPVTSEQAELLGEPVAAGTTAPAGIVRLPGEELLEAIESEEDIVRANQELLEGRALTDEESKRWQRLVSEIQRECNKRLKVKGIVLLAGVPEPNGLGFVLTGCDAKSIEAAERGITMPSEDYVVTVTLPARERVDIARTEREDFVRKFIDLICAECIEQQVKYRAKQRFFH